MDEQFPPNSRRAKAPGPDQPIKNVERVTVGEKRKPSLGSKFTKTFFGGNARSAATQTVSSTVIPMFKDLLEESAYSVIRQVIHGDSRPRRGRQVHNELGHFAYNKMSQASRPPTGTTTVVSDGARARHDFTEIIIPSLPEAHDVLERMYDLLEKYELVTVADLYALCGVRSVHTDQKWGWYLLTGSRVGRVRGGNGYVLHLPEPVELR